MTELGAATVSPARPVAAAEGADIVAFIDGDFSLLPSELPMLLAPILTGQADLVLGSRPLGQISKAPSRPPTLRQLAGVEADECALRLAPDRPGPYRAIRRDLLLSFDMHEMTFGWPTEMMVKAARRRAAGGGAGNLSPTPCRALEGQRHATRHTARRARHPRRDAALRSLAAARVCQRVRGAPKSRTAATISG